MKQKNKPSLIIFFCFLLCGCALLTPTISDFDQYTCMQVTSLKIDVLNVMDSAINNYTSQTKLTSEVNLNLKKFYEYEKTRPKNTETLNQLDILMDTTANLYGGFMLRWKKKGQLGLVFIKEQEKLVGAAFDEIVKLERKKIKK